MAALLTHRLRPSRPLGGNNLNPSLSNSAPSVPTRSTWLMELKDAFGTEYVGPIGVGTTHGPNGETIPEAVLQVVYDTGSADLWLTSDLCRRGPCSKEARRRFNHSRSETFSAPKKAARLATVYGSGVLEGELGADSVRIGPLVIQHQPLGLIAKVHGPTLEELPLDGIAGLGFPALASSGSVPLVDSLIQQGLLPKPQFAFFLQPDRALGGFVVWGGSDPRLSEGPLTWYPVIEESYWALDLVAFRVGNRSFLAEAHAAQASPKPWTKDLFRPLLLVDSGTTFLTALGDVYDAVVKVAGPRSCSEVGQLPPLVYTIMDVGGQQQDVSVPPEEYMVKVTSGTADDFCVPGIVRVGDFGPGRRSLMILGEVFMRHHLTVFDRGSAGGGAQVGLARAARGANVQSFLEEGSRR